MDFTANLNFNDMDKQERSIEASEEVNPAEYPHEITSWENEGGLYV